MIFPTLTTFTIRSFHVKLPTVHVATNGSDHLRNGWNLARLLGIIINYYIPRLSSLWLLGEEQWEFQFLSARSNWKRSSNRNFLLFKVFFTCFYLWTVNMKATAPYFYGSILLRAIKSKIIVVLTCVLMTKFLSK
jgi:hypothetical protein